MVQGFWSTCNWNQSIANEVWFSMTQYLIGKFFFFFFKCIITENHTFMAFYTHFIILPKATWIQALYWIDVWLFICMAILVIVFSTVKAEAVKCNCSVTFYCLRWLPFFPSETNCENTYVFPFAYLLLLCHLLSLERQLHNS